MHGRAVVALWLFAACAPTLGSTPSEAPLSSCVVGWWQRTAGPCDCSDKPECSAVDCERTRVRRFEANGQLTEGYLLRAPSLATTSTVAPLVVGTWTATDDTHIVMNGTGAPTEGSCTSSQLTLGSFIDARVEASLAASLTSNLETLGLSWSAARVGK